MALSKKQEELKSLVQSRLGKNFTVEIEDGGPGDANDTAIIEYPIDGRYARALAFFPAFDGRKKIDPNIINSIVYIATMRFEEQSKVAHYTEQAKADARSAYLAIIKATQS